MHFTGLQAVAVLLVSPLLACAQATVPGQIVKGIDAGAYVSHDTFVKSYRENFKHFISRGYSESADHWAGGIDPNFLSNTINAYNAGFNQTYSQDTYWFPCSGKNKNCKPYDQQVKELVEFIKTRNMPIGRVFLNIEIDKTRDGNWNYGRGPNGGNLAEAKKMMAALKAILPNSGIYSNHGEWWNIFADYTVVVDNTVPLWYALWDYDNSNDRLYPPIGMEFGGWQNSQIIGKQYSNESTSGLFDLNLFVVPQ